MTYVDEVEHRRAIRRLALQMLYQLDVRNGQFADEVRDSLLRAGHDPQHRFDGPWRVDTLTSSVDHRVAFDKAMGAWRDREPADRLATELAPEWPSRRQPVVDRNIIRLCWSEMTRGDVPPKAAVNEAVELAKIFGTERSGPFLNGVLDKMMRRLAAAREAVAAGLAPNEEAALLAGVGAAPAAAPAAANAAGASTAAMAGAAPAVAGARGGGASRTAGEAERGDRGGGGARSGSGASDHHDAAHAADQDGHRDPSQPGSRTPEDPAPWALHDAEEPVEFWTSD